MKKYNVTLHLIRDYYKDENGDRDYDQPILEMKEFTVEAENENEALNKAYALDKTKYSVWESYADEINEDKL
jgi:hypothetical protein